MTLETEGGSEAVSEAVSTPEATTTETPKSTGYSVTDPGYDDRVDEDDGDALAQLIAENKKKTPSETSDDASEPEKPTEETAETPADDAAEFDISDELLGRAVAAGYELEDIREFRDAKAFEKELSRVERIQKRLQEQKAGTESAETPEPEPEPESKEPDWDQMIQEGHDPDIIALQKSSWQRAAAAEAKVRELEQAEQVRAAAAVSDRFDETLNSLGDEYESLLGKGRRAELMKSSPEAAENRQKVFTMMTILRDGFVRNGQPVPPEADLIQQAVQASFFKQSQEIARNALKKQIKNAGSQALSRPRSGSSRELSGPERALQKEREFWKAHS